MGNGLSQDEAAAVHSLLVIPAKAGIQGAEIIESRMVVPPSFPLALPAPAGFPTGLPQRFMRHRNGMKPDPGNRHRLNSLPLAPRRGIRK